MKFSKQKKADAGTWTRLYEENRQKLYFAAYKILQDETGAEEAVYRAFKALLEETGLCQNRGEEALKKKLLVYVTEEAAYIAKICCKKERRQSKSNKEYIVPKIRKSDI